MIEGSPGEPADHADNGSHQKDNQGIVFEVVLMKGIGGLGMSLVGGTDCGEQYGGRSLISIFKLYSRGFKLFVKYLQPFTR